VAPLLRIVGRLRFGFVSFGWRLSGNVVEEAVSGKRFAHETAYHDYKNGGVVDLFHKSIPT
jgi:hypothetical protein